MSDSSTKLPVFLFAFANDEEGSLKVEKEEDTLAEILKTQALRSRVDYDSIHSANLDRIFREIHVLHNDLHIFHYGGHSNSTSLLLEDVALRASSLAQLLGNLENLKLMFLNGCANEDQVKVFLKKGVKVIIATSSNIEDNKAIDFAEQFYSALVNGRTIKDAFNAGKAYLDSKYAEEQIGIDIEKVDQPQRGEYSLEINEFAWKLFYSDEENLDWTIPPTRSAPDPEPDNFKGNESVILSHPDINKKLVDLVLEGLNDYSEEDEFGSGFWNAYQKDPENLKFRKKKIKIKESFPSIFEELLYTILSEEGEKYGIYRLESINKIYRSFIRFISYIAIANLWHEVRNAKKANESFIIEEPYKKDIVSIFDLNFKLAVHYDYVWLITTIGRIFKQNQWTPYIKGFELFFSSMIETDEYYQACRFLEKELNQKITPTFSIPREEIETLCLEAEKHLGKFLKRSAFLCYYNCPLIAVSGIKVDNPYNGRDVKFVHNHRSFEDSEEGISEKPIRRSGFTANRAILFAKNLEEDEEPLNLTPFLIDLNNFEINVEEKEGSIPQILLLDSYKSEEDKQGYIYRLSQTFEPNQNFIVNENYDRSKYEDLEIILDQLKLFKDDLGA